jgi:hypothetical protein
MAFDFLEIQDPFPTKHLQEPLRHKMTFLLREQIECVG